MSVALPELEPYTGHYYGVRSESEFVAQIERALREDSPALRRSRVAVGRENTWSARYAAIASAIKPWYGKAAVIVTEFQQPRLPARLSGFSADKTGYPNFEVIVVDDGSDQSLLDEVAPAPSMTRTSGDRQR